LKAVTGEAKMRSYTVFRGNRWQQFIVEWAMIAVPNKVHKMTAETFASKVKGSKETWMVRVIATVDFILLCGIQTRNSSCFADRRFSFVVFVLSYLFCRIGEAFSKCLIVLSEGIVGFWVRCVVIVWRVRRSVL
jgi:hypothetical protein